jgi:DNA-binding SARP family transcriptional activator
LRAYPLPEAPHPVPVIKLRVLGEMICAVRTSPSCEASRLVPSGWPVLAYLVLQTPRFQRRDTLVGLFWPEQDQDHARGSLRNLVHVLRRGLGEGVLVSRGDEELGVDAARLWCDALAFQAALKEGRPAESVELYRGDLLAGLNVSRLRRHIHERQTRRRALRQPQPRHRSALLAGVSTAEVA